MRDDAAVALQYTPCAGLASVREYLVERQAALQGRRPEPAELIVTSGGMECLALLCQALIDPGDAVAVEEPTYLGALMAFAGAEARAVPVDTDADGLVVEALAERLADGLRPKFLYVIPEYQNPTGRTLPLARRRALVELCRRHGVLIVEDVAYRELAFDGASLPTLWSLGPDVVLQAGTFSKTFFPGVRLGWAVGPADVIAELVAAKQNTDQCAGGFGQRLVEEYGRAGGFERHLPAARRALRVALGGAVGGARAPHARGGGLDRAGGRLPHLDDAPGRPRRRCPAPRRAGGGRGLRAGAAVPRGRRRRGDPAAVVQPPGTARPGARRRAARGRGGRRADAGGGIAATRPGYRINAGASGNEQTESEDNVGGISLGGILVIVGIVLMFVWSFWIGLIIALIGLIAFGGFAKGRWY